MLTVEEGGDGLCRFTLWKWALALGDGSEWDHGCWSPIRYSGLYPTAQEADEAAKAEVDWLGTWDRSLDYRLTAPDP
ncbi:MAG: hypothetical protein KL785_07780 [Brevundimonas sp.]|nr:hypothetical protein [Brevundimonas sp.]